MKIKAPKQNDSYHFFGEDRKDMYTFNALISNYLLMAAVTGWFLAQALKIVTHLAKYREFIPKLFFASGGMPSSHTSSVIALTTACAVQYGFASPFFAVTFVLSCIVMYDAQGVRRAAGEHARIINKIAKDLQKGDTSYLSKDLKELLGHTPIQVWAGAALGIIVALLLIFPYKSVGVLIF